MRFNRYPVVFGFLILAACGGASGPRGGTENSPDGSAAILADRDTVSRDNIGDKSDLPGAGVPGAAAPVDPSGTSPGGGGAPSTSPSGMVRAPVSALSPAAPVDLAVLPLPGVEAESIKKKACSHKYNQCLAGLAGDEYAIEKQRGCVSAHDACLVEKTEELKCEDGYSGCMAGIPDEAYKVEAQRACMKGKEQCLETKVYPGCCKNAYASCMGSIPAGEYRRERERVCVSAHDQCMARFYCD